MTPVVVLAALALLGCSRDPAPAAGVSAPRPAPSSAASARTPAPKGEAWRLPAPRRLVAIGDLHGDLDATRRALRLAGALGAGDRWVGGDLVVVQTGDQLDRGDDEQAILDLLERLVLEARAAGGALHVLSGNHEVMNVSGDFRYVTEGGFRDFDGVVPAVPRELLRRFPEHMRARVGAFMPGGPYARKLAAQRVVVMVGDTVFAHGGVTAAVATYGIERLNDETAAWMTGARRAPPDPIVDPEGPVWTRRYSADDAPPDCAGLAEALARLGAARMVMGHTPQLKGITSACDDRAWRIDVGMSKHYGGPVAVLEIEGGRVRPIAEAPAAAAAE